MQTVSRTLMLDIWILLDLEFLFFIMSCLMSWFAVTTIRSSSVIIIVMQMFTGHQLEVIANIIFINAPLTVQ